MASIEKLPSGRYRVKFRGPDGRWQSSGTFAAKADANAARRRIETEAEAGLSISSSDRRLTVGQYVTRPGGWLESRPWRPSTREAFDSHWRTHLEPRWGDTMLVAVRPTEVQAWVNGLSADLAPASVEALYRRLVTILRAAHADGVLARQPLAKIVLPEPPPTAGRAHVPTLDQVQAMAGAMPDTFSTLAWTIATLGLRPGEAIGLTIERVDFLRGTAVIDRQMTTTNGGARLAPLKTRRMPSREVPVPRDLVERLAAHLDRHPAMEVDDAYGGPARLIFTNRDGRPIRRGGLGYVWNEAAEKVGLPDELRGWHSLRHFAITRLIGAGVNPDYVRQFAGHTTLTETLDRYSGWWPSDADNARDVLSDALSATGSDRPSQTTG